MTQTLQFLETQQLFDKAKWGEGPWQEEPDRAYWIDRATDLDCLIVRNGTGSGALCGYVGVPPSHPWHGKSYSNWMEDDKDGTSPEDHVEVHGGLTYADQCQKDEHVCHVPRPGRESDVWWFGFDCAHLDDLCPKMVATYRDMGKPYLALTGHETYRDVLYVASQVQSLAKQLKAVPA